MSEQVHTVNIKRAKERERTMAARKAMTVIKDYVQRRSGAMPLIGQNLNHAVWKHGGKKVPSKIKITIEVDGDYAKTELFGHKFDEKTKEDIQKELKAKTKKAPKKTEEKHEHDHPEKSDGTENVPEEVKESHDSDAVQEDKKASKEAKEVKKEEKVREHSRETGHGTDQEAHQPKS